MKYIASVSFGKDSLAMLLMLIEKNYPLDEVVFYDTGVEFRAVYDTRDKVKRELARRNIEFTELKPERTMFYDMFERPVKERKGGGKHFGYSWCGGPCRWGTTAKMDALDRYCKDNLVYIGIAHDEHTRLEKERAENKVFPLADWGFTEGEALLYCYQKGFYWEECGKPLYAILDRVSCWCCANKNLKELKNYYYYLPEYWEKLKDLQRRTDRPFKGKSGSIFNLEERFKNESSKKD